MRILIVIFFLFFSLNGFAQIEKGTRTIAGSGMGSLNNYSSNSSSFSIHIEPEIGVFKRQNFLLQGYSALGFGRYVSPLYKSLDTRLGVGIGVRKYFTVSQKIMPFVGLGLMGMYFYDRENQTSLPVSNDHGVAPITWASAGASYFLTRSLVIEAALRYDIYFFDLSNQTASFRIPIGFRYLFGRD